MAKKVKELTALEVKKLSKDGFYPLGGVTGLYLRIRKNSALYTLRYSDKNLVRREFSLGSMEFHTKWDGASYDVGHALSHQVGQLFTASALFTIN